MTAALVLLKNKYVLGAVGVVALLLALLLAWTRLQGVLAERDRVRAEVERLTVEKANVEAEREKDRLAYEHQAETLRRLRSEARRVECEGDYTVTTYPDGRRVEDCKGLARSDESATTTTDSEKRPEFAPRRPPPEKIEQPKRSRWYLWLLLGAAAGAAAGAAL